MSTRLRAQFATQCNRAALRSVLESRPVDVVMTRGFGTTTISLIGASISRATYELWPAVGIRVRLLRVYVKGEPT